MTEEDRTAPRALAALDRVAAAMAFLSGGVFLVLSFYITADVIGRKFFHFSTAVSDEVGGYALALGGMWALAYTLRTGGHVRIDVLLPYLPRLARLLLDYAALATMGLFAAMIAIYGWDLALESWATDARAMSFMRTPLFAPQGLMALGFSVLGLEAVAILAVGLVDSIRVGHLVSLEIGERGEGVEAGMASEPPSL